MGTSFHFLEFPTDIVFLVILFRLRYKLSFRDITEMFLLRGFPFTRKIVRDWEERFALLMAEQLRRKRKENRKGMVCRRNVPEGKRQIHLSIPSDQQSRQSGGFTA
jgi:transposase-like protein